jgi:hypothetical protein
VSLSSKQRDRMLKRACRRQGVRLHMPPFMQDLTLRTHNGRALAEVRWEQPSIDGQKLSWCCSVRYLVPLRYVYVTAPLSISYVD